MNNHSTNQLQSYKKIFCTEQKNQAPSLYYWVIFGRYYEWFISGKTTRYPKIISLKSFGNSFGNLRAIFLILDIKQRFTCSKL